MVRQKISKSSSAANVVVASVHKKKTRHCKIEIDSHSYQIMSKDVYNIEIPRLIVRVAIGKWFRNRTQPSFAYPAWYLTCPLQISYRTHRSVVGVILLDRKLNEQLSGGLSETASGDESPQSCGRVTNFPIVLCACECWIRTKRKTMISCKHDCTQPNWCQNDVTILSRTFYSIFCHTRTAPASSSQLAYRDGSTPQYSLFAAACMRLIFHVLIVHKKQLWWIKRHFHGERAVIALYEVYLDSQ